MKMATVKLSVPVLQMNTYRIPVVTKSKFKLIEDSEDDDDDEDEECSSTFEVTLPMTSTATASRKSSDDVSQQSQEEEFFLVRKSTVSTDDHDLSNFEQMCTLGKKFLKNYLHLVFQVCNILWHL